MEFGLGSELALTPQSRHLLRGSKVLHNRPSEHEAPKDFCAKSGISLIKPHISL